MCTGVVDSPTSISAIRVNKLIHQEVLVQVPGRGIVNCRGRINPDEVNKLFREHQSDYFMYGYLDTLLVEYHNILL